ncbi:hypothetical protein GCM10009550_71680 [Actinocorallia libanotica]|uniref:Uncharacterized protein n=1 Tax=Actinocorallia libanotica TaxID=46162 RepID=A0ABN1RYR9_9ACTN
MELFECWAEALTWQQPAATPCIQARPDDVTELSDGAAGLERHWERTPDPDFSSVVISVLKRSSEYGTVGYDTLPAGAGNSIRCGHGAGGIGSRTGPAASMLGRFKNAQPRPFSKRPPETGAYFYNLLRLGKE